MLKDIKNLYFTFINTSILFIKLQLYKFIIYNKSKIYTYKDKNFTVLECDFKEGILLNFNENLIYKDLEIELIKNIFDNNYMYFINTRVICMSENGTLISKSLKKIVCLKTNKLLSLLTLKNNIINILNYYNVTNVVKITYFIHKYEYPAI
jgi:hypothetical protein